jgi:hypothetical protein
MDSRMDAERPIRVFPNAEFCKYETEVTVVVLTLMYDTTAPPILNLGQLINVIATPISPKVWLM